MKGGMREDGGTHRLQSGQGCPMLWGYDSSSFMPAAKTAAFTFVCGPDDFMVSRAAQEQWQELVKGVEDDFGREVISGAAGNVGEVEAAVGHFLSAIQTMPMFGGKKVVWLKDISFLADSITGRAEGTEEAIKRLQAALEGNDPTAVGVLLSASPVDRRKSAYKWFEKRGEVVFVGGESKRGDNQADVLLGLIQAEAQAQGVTFTANAARLLAERLTGPGSSRLAVEEVRKLATYAISETTTISEQLVADMVPPFGDSDFFEPAEAFFSGRLDWVMDALKRYFFAGNDARPLLSSLQNRNRLLIQIRVLSDAGALGRGGINQGALEQAGSKYAQWFEGVTEKSSYNVFTQNPWYLGRLAGAAQQFSLKQLVGFQGEFLRAFEGLIRRPKEQEEVLREMAVRTLGV